MRKKLVSSYYAQIDTRQALNKFHSTEKKVIYEYALHNVRCVSLRFFHSSWINSLTFFCSLEIIHLDWYPCRGIFCERAFWVLTNRVVCNGKFVRLFIYFLARAKNQILYFIISLKYECVLDAGKKASGSQLNSIMWKIERTREHTIIKLRSSLTNGWR